MYTISEKLISIPGFYLYLENHKSFLKDFGRNLHGHFPQYLNRPQSIIDELLTEDVSTRSATNGSGVRDRIAITNLLNERRRNFAQIMLYTSHLSHSKKERVSLSENQPHLIDLVGDHLYRRGKFSDSKTLVEGVTLTRDTARIVRDAFQMYNEGQLQSASNIKIYILGQLRQLKLSGIITKQEFDSNKTMFDIFFRRYR